MLILSPRLFVWQVQLNKLAVQRSEEHTSELQSQSNLVCRLLLEKKKQHKDSHYWTKYQYSALATFVRRVHSIHGPFCGRLHAHGADVRSIRCLQRTVPRIVSLVQ